MNAGLWLCIRLPRLAHEAGAAAEHAAMERLAAWAYQWSSLVSYRLADGPLLWLELAASRNLFGGHAALLANIEAGLTQLGYSHACALAPSPTGAALLTQVGQQRCVTTRSQLRSRLEPLPLALLALSPEVLAALHAAGLRRIGQLLQLPAAAIARRFGPAASLYLQRLCGRGERSAAGLAPARDLSRAFRIPGVKCTIPTRLLFPLRRLLLEFQGYLRGRDCAVLRFTLEFEHYRQAASGVTIGMSAPARDAAQFLLLSRERLQNLVLPARGERAAPGSARVHRRLGSAGGFLRQRCAAAAATAVAARSAAGSPGRSAGTRPCGSRPTTGRSAAGVSSRRSSRRRARISAVTGAALHAAAQSAAHRAAGALC